MKHRLFFAALLVGALAQAAAGQTRPAPVELRAIGASLPGPILTKLADAYNAKHPESRILYDVTGAGKALELFADQSLPFVAVDVPLAKSREKNLKGKVLQLPVAGSALVVCYNLRGIENVRLNGPVLAEIYRRRITLWNDPKIAALNPTLKLPGVPIVPLYKSGGSAINYVFTDFLSNSSPEWLQEIGRGLQVQWPTGLEVKTADIPFKVLQTTPATVGPYEFWYAKKNRLPFATLVNPNGKEVGPNPEAVTAAAEAVFKDHPEELLASITSQNADAAYPLGAYSFLLVYEELSYLGDKKKAQALAGFLQWSLTEGQALAPPLNYARLPSNAQLAALARLKALTYQGEPLLK